MLRQNKSFDYKTKSISNPKQFYCKKGVKTTLRDYFIKSPKDCDLQQIVEDIFNLLKLNYDRNNK